MAAPQGMHYAQFRLAALYQHGKGGAVDYARALQWYQKAEEQQDPDAMRAIAYMYEHGEGVEINLDTAQQWYVKADEQKYGHIQDRLSELQAQLRLQLSIDDKA